MTQQTPAMPDQPQLSTHAFLRTLTLWSVVGMVVAPLIGAGLGVWSGGRLGPLIAVGVPAFALFIGGRLAAMTSGRSQFARYVYAVAVLAIGVMWGLLWQLVGPIAYMVAAMCSVPIIMVLLYIGVRAEAGFDKQLRRFGRWAAPVIFVSLLVVMLLPSRTGVLHLIAIVVAWAAAALVCTMTSERANQVRWAPTHSRDLAFAGAMYMVAMMFGVAACVLLSRQL